MKMLMNTIATWYHRNYTQITWFIIGWIGFQLLRDLSIGDWSGALLDSLLLALNYSIYKKN